MKIYKYLLLFVITIFIAGCGIYASDITEIKLVNIKNGEKSIISMDSETAENISDALRKNEKSDEDITSLFPFEVYINKNSEVEVYIFSFDIENQGVYISKDNEIHKVRDNIAKKLLLDDYFSYIYIDNTIYDISLIYNDKNIKPNVEYNWTYKDVDGNFVKKQGTLTEDNENIIIKDNDTLDITYEVEPDNQVTRIYKEGNIIHTGKTINDVLNKIYEDGEYFIETEAHWLLKSDSEYFGNQTISFMVEVDFPADFTIVSKENYPGNILVLTVENLNKYETVSINTDINKVEDIEVYSYKDKYMSIFPIDLYVNSGEYEVKAVFNEGKGTAEYTKTRFITIREKNFKVQYLTVSEEMNDTNNNDEAIIEFAQLVKPARTVSSPEKLWEGPFIMPIEGTLTTDYAEIRYVNNEPSSSRHSGIDLAAPIGTEVKAPNNGIVTFAMNGLLSPGNTIVIDHGLGLFSSYYHLDSILVKEGETVEKGDVIGTVGSTGFSTGPHLHYAISIYNTYVNTYQPLSGIID